MNLTTFKPRLAVSLLLLLFTACTSREPDTRKTSASDPVTLSSTPASVQSNAIKPLRDVDRKMLVAAEASDVTSVVEALDAGANINAREETYGRTPLMEAAISNHLKVAEKLIERGADINARASFFGSTPLMFAAGSGSLKIVKLLLEKGADVNVTNDKGYTALDAAEEEFHKDVIAVLKKAGAKKSEKPDTTSLAEKESDLGQAAADGNIEKIRGLLEQGVNVNAIDESGWTPLRRAVFQEDIKTVRFLLANEADPDIPDRKDNTTPLAWAAQVGNAEIVTALLDAGANPNTQDSLSFDTPLMAAANSGHVVVVRILIAKGADVNATDKWGERVLAQVIESGESAMRAGRASDVKNIVQIIKLLQRAGAKPE
jgi:ankyrin repeat protein